MRPPQARDEGAAPSGRALGPAVQGVITSPHRKLALIDGKIVPLGGSVRDGTLGSISDSFAVLRKNGEREVLLMHPNVDKKPARRELP